MTFVNLQVMTETEAKAVSRWQGYQDSKAPMMIRPTPADFPDFEFHRAFIVVPQDSIDFVMADFPTADDAKIWCSERNFHVVDAR